MNKILYLHATGYYSGAENSLLHLVTRLDKDKYIPIFLSPENGEFFNRLINKNVQVIPHDFGRNRDILKLAISIQKICQIIRSQEIDLLHSNGPQTNIPAGIAGRLMKVPVVWHARNLLANGMTDIDKLAGFLPKLIICNSEAIKTRFRGKKSYRIAKTIMNGVDIKDYNHLISPLNIRKEFNIPPDAKVIGMSSRLTEEKGHLTLLKAVAEMKKYNSNIWILIIGSSIFDEDAKFPEFLKKKAQKLGIAHRTVFTGFRRDVYRLYAAMDVFFLGTNAEPCGRVIFEAMAMGKPVVGTNNGGTPEIVVNNETGLLFEYDNVGELIQKLKLLISQPELIKKYGLAGRERIKKHFGIEKHVKKTEEEYMFLLAQ